MHGGIGITFIGGVRDQAIPELPNVFLDFPEM
jgi:hypothetical protein